MASGNKPVHEIRLSRVKAAIWDEFDGEGPSIQRIDRQALQGGRSMEGYHWFGRDDLQLVAKVADMAHTWIFQNAESLEEAAA